MKKLESLQNIGLKHNTDKAGGHCFCDFYESHLEHMRYDQIRILEIGIDNGRSLKMWNEFFPNAIINAVDIASESIELVKQIPGVHELYKADMDCVSVVERLSKEFEWDLIVDDGGHTMRQQQLAFRFLWPKVKPCGFFIIEDLHTSTDAQYIPTHNQYLDPTTYDMIVALRDNKPFDSLYLPAALHSEYQKSIKHVEIFQKDPRNLNISVTSIIRKL
jgi:hypothetical protein